MPHATVPISFPLAAFGGVDWAVLAGYFALMIAIGFAVARGKQSTREYFLAGRSLPTWALAVSIVATTLSAATFIGVPDEVYLGDVSYLILFLGTFLAVFIVALLFVPRLYRAGTVTIYGYLRPRLGEGAVTAVSCTFLVGRLLASGTRLFFAAIPLTLLLFGTEHPEQHKPQLVLAICMIGLLGTFYTVKGGIRAVVWTDAIQLFLVIGAACLTVGLLLHRIGRPPAELWSILRQDGKLHLLDTSLDFAKPYTLWAAIFGYVFLNVANYGVDHDFAQRFLVSRSAVRGGLSVIVSQFITVAVVCLFMAVGLLLYIFYKRPDVMGAAAPAHVPAGKAAGASPHFLLSELPPVFSGLAVAGLFAVAQGSMDSAINAMASSAVADLYFPLCRRLGRPVDPDRSSATPRVAVAVIGVVLTVFAIACAYLYDPQRQTLLQFALGIMNFAFAGMLGVFLTAMFTRRGNVQSVICALLAGAATIALLQPAALPWWTGHLLHHPVKLAMPWGMPIGTAVSFLVCVAGGPTRPRGVTPAPSGRGFEVV